ALDADAGADRIDIPIARADRDLGARAGLPGDRLDANDLLVDLGHFHLEQLFHKALGGARQHDLRTARVALDVGNESDDSVTRAIALARHLLAHRENGFGAAEVDDDVAALKSPDDPRDQLALAIFVFVEDVFALRLAYTLDDHLLCGLRRDAAEVLDGIAQIQHLAPLLLLLLGALGVLVAVENLEQQLVTRLGARIDFLRVGSGDFPAVNLRRIRHHNHEEQIDDTGLVVIASLDLAVHAKDLLGRRENGLLQRLDQDLLIDVLVLGDLIDDHVEVGLH